MQLQVDVMVWRGAIAESRHRVQVAVCDAEGRLILGTESPDLVTTFRSAAKPFQLLPLIERHARRFAFSDEEIAVMASSHTGSADHVALVQGILDRAGLSERQLACGLDDPLDPEARAARAAHPESGGRRSTTTARESTPACCASRSPRAGRSRATSAPTIPCRC